jgi:hypothetical protein
LRWLKGFWEDRRGGSLVEYLIGAAVLAGVAYYCRNVLVTALRAGHNTMVENVTKITGN